MEPILTKQEIAELLAAIKQGKVSTDLETADSLFVGKEAKPLNLFQMGTFDDEQVRIPNFDIILDAFCQNYSISLTNQLQRTFAMVKPGSIPSNSRISCWKTKMSEPSGYLILSL